MKKVHITHAVSPTGEKAIFETDLTRFNEDAVYFTEKFFEYAKKTGLKGEAVETIFTIILEAVEGALRWDRKRPLDILPIEKDSPPRTTRINQLYEQLLHESHLFLLCRAILPQLRSPRHPSRRYAEGRGTKEMTPHHRKRCFRLIDDTHQHAPWCTEAIKELLGINE